MKAEVKHLRKEFGGTVAMDDLSFTVSSGEVLGFVGPNGSGKTTTMNIIATLEDPSWGDVFIDGLSVLDYPDEARKIIGYMPDSLPDQSDISAHEYIDFFARAYGFKGKVRKARVKEVEDFTDVTPIRHKTLAELSRGMKQRVSLARAIIHDPQLLIMDEPANGLDPRARVEFRSYVKKLAGSGKAVLISSHILSDLNEICTGCIVLEQGRLVRKIEGELKNIDLESVFMEITKGDVQ